MTGTALPAQLQVGALRARPGTTSRRDATLASLRDDTLAARRDERDQIARDLHDAVLQQVFSLRLQAAALCRYLGGVPSGEPVEAARVRDAAGELLALAGDAVAELRALIVGLRPPGFDRLAPAGGPAAAGAAARVVRVMIVDDHAVVRRGLVGFFADVPDVEVVLQAPDGLAALERLDAVAAGQGELPDVALVDLQMPRLDGLGTLRLLAERHPGMRVVILSSFAEPERIHAALQAGAAGYLLKDAEPEEIVIAVRAAVAGGVHLDPMVARRLTRRMTSPTTGVSTLTPRERDILSLVASGCSNRQIADRLQITERTARTHVSNVLAKLHLRSRTQAALTAIREGLVPVPVPPDQSREEWGAPRHYSG